MKRSVRNAALAILILVGFGSTYEITTGAAGANESDKAWSFDMWCLEMQLYPSQQCDARRPEDVKEYEQYRARVEQYDPQHDTRLKRDQELLQRLSREAPGAPQQPLSK